MNTKITGEEKHYQKLNTRLQQELNQLKTEHRSIRSDNSSLRDMVYDLQSELDDSKKENQFLKEKLNLTDEEVKKLIKASSAINMLVGMGDRFKYGW